MSDAPGPSPKQANPGVPAGPPVVAKRGPGRPPKAAASGIPPTDRAHLTESETTTRTRPAEPKDERAHRLRLAQADAEHKRAEERRDSAHARWRATMTHGVIIAFTAVAFAFAVVVIASPARFPDARWAPTLLTTIVSGGLGYALRGAGPK